MREIKFRGKRIDNNEWIHGHYYEYSGKHIICYQDHSDNVTTDHFGEVNPKTIAQFTELRDKNDNEVYDGDVVELNENDFGSLDPDNISHHHIYWDDTAGKFRDTRLQDGDSLSGYLDGDISFVLCGVVIGNVDDNPELIA